MSLKAAVFDFDGTIADSVLIGLKIFNKLSKKYGYREIVNPESRRDRTVREIVKELNIPIYKIPFIEKEVKLQLNKQIKKMKIFPGLKNALMKLKEYDMKICILTTNTEKNVYDFIHYHDLDIFDIVIAKGNVFGKAGLIKELLRNNGFSKNDVVYIGDEIRDIEAAKKNGIKIISVTWGINSRDSLEKRKPDYIVEKPEELLEVIRKL